MKKLIILDRDGVINHDSAEYIKSPDEWIPIEGSLAAIAKLKQAGYQIAVATNQSGIARGLYNEKMLALIHAKMQSALAKHGANIDAIFYCPHKPSAHCHCRKPKIGLFEQIAKYFNIELRGNYYIGDKKSDIDAGSAANCKPMLVRSGYGERTLQRHPDLKVPVFNNLAEAVEAIIQGTLK